MLQKSEYKNYTKAAKGKAWIRKTYKKMLINKCQCGKIMVNRTSRQKCDECIEREWRLSRLRTCSCGTTFMLMDHQNGGERICPRCKNAKYEVAFNTIMTFFNENNPLAYLNLPERIRTFSSIQRNVIQAVTDFAEFKLRHIKFQSVPYSSQTFDHVNAMTYLIENYIRECLSDSLKKNFEYFREYLLKYAVQFRVTPSQNMALARFQVTGITPSQYISIVGPIEGMTIKETEEAIREHFIHG
jgi:hypothetical protein